MPLNEQEISDALSERQNADVVLDRYGALRSYYRDFQDELEQVYRVYRNEWSMLWPDGRAERMDPSVPNMVRLAADDRARSAAATPPSFMCHPDGPGDEARAKTDKMERIVSGWADNARIRGHTTKMWAYDAMAGLTVCRVLPDFKQLTVDPAMAFPKIERLSPTLSYPDPVFAPGPFLDNFIYAYEDKLRTAEIRFGVQMPWNKDPNSVPDKVKIIEFYDDTYYYVVFEQVPQQHAQNFRSKRELVVAEKHRMGKCPVVISASATMDGTYSGEFISGLGVQAYWNRLMTLVMDDAVRKVYPERVTYNAMNPEDWGPDATIQLETQDGRYEYVQQGNQAFSNLQVLRDVGQSVRTSFIMPPSRTGDPNESIISAAGINASTTQFNEDVRSIQRDMLQPMLEAAFELACAAEENWTPDVRKSVWAGEGRGYRETYVPAKDINGYRRVQVRYGAASGLDEINQNVMVLQQLGARIIDRRTAMEMSPFVEDAQRVEKRMLKETMQDAMLAGLAQQAQQGLIDPFALAMIDQAVESDEVSLSEAIAAFAPQAPLAPPATAPGAPPEAPGIAGAAEGPQESNMPPLAELIGG